MNVTAGHIALDIYESNGHAIVVQLERLISDHIIISIWGEFQKGEGIQYEQSTVQDQEKIRLKYFSIFPGSC